MKNLLVIFAAVSLILIGCGKEYDDSALTGRMDNLENRVLKLEELCKQLNTNISSLQTIVSALQKNDYITSVAPIIQDGKTIGYTISFAKSPKITIYHGQDGKDGTNGKDGQDGHTPIIGVKRGADGIYYWTLDGNWLTDSSGQMIKAVGVDGKNGINGTDGKNGEDGQDGITPQLKIENNYWYVSYDNGSTWEQLGKATGEDGKDGSDGDSMFRSVNEDDDNVYFELTGGTTITIPKGGSESKFAIEFDNTDIVAIEPGETITVNYTITAATENTVVKVVAQNGWAAKVVPTSVSVGSIKITVPDPLVEGEILVFVNDGTYRTLMVTLQCSRKILTILADNAFDVPTEGGTYQVKLQTNTDYTINIPDNAKSWLSVADTRAMRNETLTFSAAANTTITERFATVALTGRNNEILQSVTFRQSGDKIEGMLEINEETIGTLQQLLDPYDKSSITAMKITGVMNDKDFLQIYHEMPALRDLDISEVNITTLPNRSFYQSKNVENIILPKILTTIPDEVFCGSAIKNITLYNNVTVIGASAFQNCKGLSSISIPANVTSIGASAFAGCTSLSAVTFDDKCALTALNNYTFTGCPISNIRIPAKVATIGSTAFSKCNVLQSVTFESDSELTQIAESTFKDLTALQSIEIPANVNTIGASAFSGCKILTNVTFEPGSNLNIIGSDAFAGCTSLAEIDIPSNVSTISYGAFYNCQKLTAIEIPASVETIGHSAFQKSALTAITFGKGSKLKSIGGVDSNLEYLGAFYGCPLKSITIPASVESIGATAFKDCKSLTTVIFEKGSKLNTINGGADRYFIFDYGTFSGCTSLTAIEIPANVETIGIAAFKGCVNLKTVTFESRSRLQTIGGGGDYYNYYGAFCDCSSLTEIEIPASVVTIGDSALRNCTKLAEINFQEGSLLQDIKTYAFYNCADMHYFYATHCTKLKNVRDCAFAQNNEIWYFEIGAPTPPQCGRQPFDNVGTYSVLKVPASAIDKYRSANIWSSFASITEIDKKINHWR